MTRARRGRAEGSIFQRQSDGRWVGSISLGFSDKGKRRRKTIYGETKKEVQERIRELQNSAAAGRLPQAGAMTVSTYFRVWLDGIKASLEPTTWAAYDGHFRNHIGPRIGGVKLGGLTAVHAIDLYSSMVKVGVSSSTTRKVGITLNAGLDAAVNMALVPYNVAASVPKPKPEHHEVRVFTADQVNVFLSEAAKDRLFALYVAAVDSGCRQGELYALCWSDFDPEAGTFTITKSLAELNGKLWVKDVKTKNGRRRVQLNFCLDELEKHRERMKSEGQDVDEGLVFPDTEGKPLRKSNVWRRSFVPILKRAKLPVSTRFHDLRHACASLLLVAGADVKVVSERLGHGSAAFTMGTYQHVLPGLQQDAADRLCGVLTPKPKASKPAEKPLPAETQIESSETVIAA